MPDKVHTPNEPVRKEDSKAMATIRRRKANADLGEFRGAHQREALPVPHPNRSQAAVATCIRR